MRANVKLMKLLLSQAGPPASLGLEVDHWLRCHAAAKLSIRRGAVLVVSVITPQILGIALQRHCGGSGILHLALHGNPQGLVRSWQQTLLSVAEPGTAVSAATLCSTMTHLLCLSCSQMLRSLLHGGCGVLPYI